MPELSLGFLLRLLAVLTSIGFIRNLFLRKVLKDAGVGKLPQLPAAR